MSEQTFLSQPKPLSHHLQDFYSIIKSTVILVGLCSILWSLASTSLLAQWASSFNFISDSDSLAIYSPYDWVEIKWSFSILMSIMTVIPITSYMFFNFAKPGLYPHEYKWLRLFLAINSIILPLLILLIWFWIIPEMANALSSSELNNVSPSYDIAEISRFTLGITWVAIISLVLINTLSIARSTNNHIGIYFWLRSRMIIICLGLLILTLPTIFDGLRILMSISVIFLCDALSRLIPMSNIDT